MSLMEQFADPNTFEALSAGEKTAGGLITTLMGMGITFVVLIILWVCITIMTKCVKAADARKAAKTLAAASPAAAIPAAPAATPAPAAAQAPTEDANLVAVIMAAIAASSNSCTSNLVVRKISRAAGIRQTWSVAGSMDCVDSRKM